MKYILVAATIATAVISNVTSDPYLHYFLQIIAICLAFICGMWTDMK